MIYVWKLIYQLVFCMVHLGLFCKYAGWIYCCCESSTSQHATCRCAGYIHSTPWGLYWPLLALCTMSIFFLRTISYKKVGISAWISAKDSQEKKRSASICWWAWERFSRGTGLYFRGCKCYWVSGIDYLLYDSRFFFFFFPLFCPLKIV